MYTYISYILIYLYLKNIHHKSFLIPKIIFNHFFLGQTKTCFMAQSYINFCHVTEFKLKQSDSGQDFSL